MLFRALARVEPAQELVERLKHYNTTRNHSAIGDRPPLTRGSPRPRAEQLARGDRRRSEALHPTVAAAVDEAIALTDASLIDIYR
jgi:hypothetical protein